MDLDPAAGLEVDAAGSQLVQLGLHLVDVEQRRVAEMQLDAGGKVGREAQELVPETVAQIGVVDEDVVQGRFLMQQRHQGVGVA